MFGKCVEHVRKRVKNAKALGYSILFNILV